MVQQHVVDNVLAGPDQGDSGVADWKLDMVQLFKAGDIQKARKLVCASARPEEMEDIYRWMYDNIDLFGKDEETKDQAIIIIKQGLLDHALCADGEINMAATMIKLARLQ
jgi:hypothetical protein